ncbi:MAG: hypothetical protein U1E87_01770 [Alphaproteobacteria bacterium]
MGVRTVRMEPEDEKLLTSIRRRTGWTASDALRRGLRLLDLDLSRGSPGLAHSIYLSFDLGSGGYAAGPSDQSSKVAREVIKRKYDRR